MIWIDSSTIALMIIMIFIATTMTVWLLTNELHNNKVAKTLEIYYFEWEFFNERWERLDDEVVFEKYNNINKEIIYQKEKSQNEEQKERFLEYLNKKRK
jgi:ABC-type xylose transport system substrate-binding protein